jgi:hypothetical protein
MGLPTRFLCNSTSCRASGVASRCSVANQDVDPARQCDFVRQVTDLDGHFARRTAAHDPQPDRGVRREALDGAYEIAPALDTASVDSGDDVACLQPGSLGRRPGYQSDEAGAALTRQPVHTRLFGGEILQFNADVAKFLSDYRGRGEEKRESDKQMNGGPTVQRHGYLARC